MYTDDILTLLVIQKTEIYKLQRENCELKSNGTNTQTTPTADTDNKLRQVQKEITNYKKNTTAAPSTPIMIQNTDFPTLGQ